MLKWNRMKWKGMNGKNDERMNENGVVRMERRVWSDIEEYGLKDRNGIECKKGEDRVC